MESQIDYWTARALLEWQVELGATEAIQDVPVDRYAAKAEAAKAAGDVDQRSEKIAEQSLLAAERAQQRAKALEDAALIEAQRRKTADAAQPPPLPSGTMTALPPQMQEPVKKAQALTAELHRAKVRLKDLHQQALQTPVVLASQDKLEAAALREIEKTAPGIKPEWHRLKALANEMEELRKTARSGRLPQGIQGILPHPVHPSYIP